jgi:hypothetical protein
MSASLEDFASGELRRYIELRTEYQNEIFKSSDDRIGNLVSS